MENNDEMKLEEFDAVVLANGDYPVEPIPMEVLRTAKFVACCDGAAEEYIRRVGTPHLIVGDCDSVPPHVESAFSSIIVKVDEQEYNDLTKTVRHLASLGMTRIAIVGATGKREDHTLGNISLCMEYMRMGLEVRMFTDHGVFIPSTDTATFPCRPYQQVSIFSFGAKGLRAEGLVYPLSDFTNWWQGTLNECISSSFTIHAEGDYLVYLVF